MVSSSIFQTEPPATSRVHTSHQPLAETGRSPIKLGRVDIMLHTARTHADTHSESLISHSPSAAPRKLQRRNGAGEGVRAGDVDERGAGAGLPGGGGRRVRGRQHRLQGHGAQEPRAPRQKPVRANPCFPGRDLLLWESRAISKYVLRKYKTDEVNLLREGNLKEAAMVDVWTEVDAHTYNPALSPIVYECLINPMMKGIPTNEMVVAESLEKLKKVLEVYEARLSQHKYLAGDFVSFADLNHFPYTFYFMATPHAVLFDSYPHVKAWWESIMARPAVKKLAATMVPPKA